MSKIAFVFSGQGAQATGMGKFLYDNYENAKQVFEKAEKLRHGTLEQCFSGSKEELSQTVNTQPCLFTVDLAAAYALSGCGIKAEGAAGFSLGEVAAAVYSGMLEFEDGFRLVCKRAEIMDKYSTVKGAMAAVLKLTVAETERICLKTGGVYPVNYNCEGQTVIAGEQGKLDEAVKSIAEAGGRAIRLSVSGAFHSPYMNEASERFKEVTKCVAFSKPHMSLYSNVTALPYGDNPSELLALQIKSPVLWQKSVENMIKSGYDTFIETGVGNTLCNLIKRINPNVKAFNTNNKEEFEAALAAV